MLIVPLVARFAFKVQGVQTCSFPYHVRMNPIYIIQLTHTLIHYTIDFKQFPTCFDMCYIIFRGIELERLGTAEASQSLYLQVCEIVAI
jgi:hypothetical protein